MSICWKVDSGKRGHESTRLLYVAATRARKHLHLLGHATLDREGAALKAPNPRALLAKIWRTVEPAFDRPRLKSRGIPERALKSRHARKSLKAFRSDAPASARIGSSF